MRGVKTMDKQTVNEIRKEFPYLDEAKMGRKIVYLDNGATSQKPQCVIDALANYYSYQNATIWECWQLTYMKIQGLR